MPVVEDMRDAKVIAPNFKRRLSGVTSTIIQLVPVQNRLGQKVVTLGSGLPATLPKMRWLDLPALWSDGMRVWHARRNIEMLAGIVLRDLLRMRLKLVFTSASQRRHTGWTKFLISRMDAVVATSARTASYLEVPSTVVMHGIDPQRFSPPAEKGAAKALLGLDPARNYAGCFGRVRHQKGTDLFVDAMIRLLPDQPAWSAIVAGRATTQHVDFENELKKRVQAAGLADRILFVGEHTNINDWYRALDLFIAPQRWEGFGLTPLEAMATGIPVVATDVGAFNEIVTPDTGDVVSADNLEALTQAAKRYMDDASLRQLAGEQGRQRAEAHFSIEGEAAALGRIYA
ncbi:glycosyltransferase family 4 protein [Shinella sp. CPCC 101442]|uniref:glycosyltransferase family 4 protein n=1 Tax=Shinella sp. CPCC 101442 TaxID=2932265 RepID=UPI002153567D|nr:glycosyltransferase family 4 protein [Shinella sp. CPCC 101442]MCR6500194.1 glycosyltransferase family 4 protein [Shinella sp. CPCC 101442]